MSHVTLLKHVGVQILRTFCLLTSSANVVRKIQGDPVSALVAVLRRRVGLSQSRQPKHGYADLVSLFASLCSSLSRHSVLRFQPTTKAVVLTP